MTNNPDSRPGKSFGTIVNLDLLPIKPPPLLAVGPLAWIRKNLFSSWLDSLLTVIAIVMISGAAASFLFWAIAQANWFVVSFNMRLLMVGRFPVDAEWRLVLLVGILTFTIGLSLAAWSRVSRSAFLVMIGLLLVLFVLPPLINGTMTLSPSYFAAGNKDIVAGASTETPQPNLAFIARSGETITVRRADSLSASDEALSTLHGFADKAAALLGNTASNRLDTIAQTESLKAQLTSDLLTDGQRARLTTQLSKLDIPPVVAQTFKVNQGAIKVSVLDGKTLKPVASATLSASSDEFRVTVPADGWYVLEKVPVDSTDTSAAILQVQGITPFLSQQFSVSGTPDANGNITASEQVIQYIRVTDNYTTQAIRPTIDDKNVPMVIVFDNAYHGNHTLTDFLRLYIAPFFDSLKMPYLALLIVGTLGYLAAGVLDQIGRLFNSRRRLSPRVAVWLLIAMPVLMFGLAYGVGNILPLTDTRRWGGLFLTVILTVVGIIASFPLGVALALGRRSALPVVSIASTIYIEFVRGVPLITVLFMAQLLVPLINPTLAEMPNVFRAMIAITLFNAAYLAENVRGGLQSIPHGQQEAAKALGLSNFQIVMDITLPQALRAIFPALVGMVISLFKDTSLVTIVGLLDLTGTAQAIVTQTEFIGLRRETLIFITIIYFVVSYAIAGVSRRIERSGAGASLAQTI
jgi:His/Glu/Gln/Arg/opine family amino acid ABC transporter permease subunit